MPQTPVRRFEFEHFKRRLIIFCVIISLGCSAGIYNNYHESKVRTHQFCEITVARANDGVERFDTTVDYLRSPFGQEKTSLNKVIRDRSLPTLADNVQFDLEHRATVCTKYPEDFNYKDTKYPETLKKVEAQQKAAKEAAAKLQTR